MKSELIKGGQGRSAREIEEQSSAWWWTVAIILGVALILWGLEGWWER